MASLCCLQIIIYIVLAGQTARGGNSKLEIRNEAILSKVFRICNSKTTMMECKFSGSLSVSVDWVASKTRNYQRTSILCILAQLLARVERLRMVQHIEYKSDGPSSGVLRECWMTALLRLRPNQQTRNTQR